MLLEFRLTFVKVMKTIDQYINMYLNIMAIYVTALEC